MEPRTIAVFTKNTTNPAYAAFRLAADRIAGASGVRTVHFVPTRPDDACCMQGDGLRERGVGFEFCLLPVAPLRLEEDHRVVAADRLLDHGVGVGRVPARDHPQAGGVREQHLGGLAVVLDRGAVIHQGPARPLLTDLAYRKQILWV